ncbi:ribosome maturation factor RimP [Spiroplasma citri]|uniref:Ribosome maturation factor RimP n=1 Tax=Spiroplasma citri TaxID=2133 RepID=Q14LK7_SPICI|nr:ribosome maturation factor RimP [Spiroplasma citri]APE75471.1 ribosome maturation factor RimP [Spiroplasma citri]QIA67676.1 ribosome maturation factor RimP [Spiroplasma citri]QIA69526.1 ribosome maturation factor RimP [Spiroplasma citri]QIA71392.1 ribosome maturation factor RimP [Spiroplasma citri]QIA73526.1 ribosome maturation factor RimP [Spiroplasma citri]
MEHFIQQETQLKETLENYLTKQNLTLFAINYFQDFDTNVVQVLIEDKTTVFDLERLTVISEEINQLVDNLDLFSEEYLLEVSTPGAERPLRNWNELQQHLKGYVYLEFNEKVNNLVEVTGELSMVDQQQNLTITYFVKGARKTLQTNYQNIKFARCAVKF